MATSHSNYTPAASSSPTDLTSPPPSNKSEILSPPLSAPVSSSMPSLSPTGLMSPNELFSPTGNASSTTSTSSGKSPESLPPLSNSGSGVFSPSPVASSTISTPSGTTSTTTPFSPTAALPSPMRSQSSSGGGSTPNSIRMREWLAAQRRNTDSPFVPKVNKDGSVEKIAFPYTPLSSSFMDRCATATVRTRLYGVNPSLYATPSVKPARVNELRKIKADEINSFIEKAKIDHKLNLVCVNRDRFLHRGPVTVFERMSVPEQDPSTMSKSPGALEAFHNTGGYKHSFLLFQDTQTKLFYIAKLRKFNVLTVGLTVTQENFDKYNGPYFCQPELANGEFCFVIISTPYYLKNPMNAVTDLEYCYEYLSAYNINKINLHGSISQFAPSILAMGTSIFVGGALRELTAESGTFKPTDEPVKQACGYIFGRELVEKTFVPSKHERKSKDARVTEEHAKAITELREQEKARRNSIDEAEKNLQAKIDRLRRDAQKAALEREHSALSAPPRLRKINDVQGIKALEKENHSRTSSTVTSPIAVSATINHARTTSTVDNKHSHLNTKHGRVRTSSISLTPDNSEDSFMVPVLKSPPVTKRTRKLSQDDIVLTVSKSQETTAVRLLKIQKAAEKLRYLAHSPAHAQQDEKKCAEGSLHSSRSSNNLAVEAVTLPSPRRSSTAATMKKEAKEEPTVKILARQEGYHSRKSSTLNGLIAPQPEHIVFTSDAPASHTLFVPATRMRSLSGSSAAKQDTAITVTPVVSAPSSPR